MPRSDSDAAFARLHPDIQRWVWSQGWKNLRPIQADAVPVILDRVSDVVISAPTAGGKTEAAFLPILSDLAVQEARGRLGVMCVSPLRALINDQARRLQSMAEACDLRVQAWHGDVTVGKQSFWKRPAEVLIITPESLEALLMRRSRSFEPLARTLRYVVVDELHAFLSGERGAQLQSLLRRVEALAQAEVPRVALSATLADPAHAGVFLRPSRSRPVAYIRPSELAGSALRVVLKVMLDQEAVAPTQDAGEAEVLEIPAPPTAGTGSSEDAPQSGPPAQVVATTLPDAPVSGALVSVAQHLYERLRGDTHLVFANSRTRVETLSALLADLSERQGVPNEFFPHHGSLSKEVRIDVEERLREGLLPTTAIATSTLEMGIDLGDVATIAQIGPAPSVAALKQRIGRSGRRPGTSQTLRQYILLRPIDARSHPIDYLRLPLVQAIAQLELMIEGIFEPPTEGDLHLSTLVQQILSVIYEHGGGASVPTLWNKLGGAGAFAAIDKPTFVDVLRALKASKVIEQADDGTVLPGESGERLAEHYTFYASFATPEEYALVAYGRVIGRLPVDALLVPGQQILFSGRRWRVIEVRTGEKTVLLERAKGGQPPEFDGGAPIAHAIVHERMRRILSDEGSFAYLDDAAVEALALARSAFVTFGFEQCPFFASGSDIYIGHWAGSRTARTVALALRRAGLTVEDDGPFLCVSNANLERVHGAIADIMQMVARGELVDLASDVPTLVEEKNEAWLASDRTLLERGWSARWIDVEGAMRVFSTLRDGIGGQDARSLTTQ